MTTKDLLFELGTEELPTKAVKNLSLSLTSLMSDELKKNNLNFNQIKPIATPRRLGFIVYGLQTKQEDYINERRGPAVKAAFDKSNNFTKAALGFAQSCNISPEQLETLETDKGSWLIYKQAITGSKTTDLLQQIISSVIKKLPITKPMRWSNHDYAFVRPVHWILLKFDSETIEINLLGLKSGNVTYGHRFLSSSKLIIENTSDYKNILNDHFVIVDFDIRKQEINNQVINLAESKKLKPLLTEDLLDEVTSLVEWPVALMGEFAPEFLDVPQECLITSMVSNQKYFALVDETNKLKPFFIFISNIASKNPAQVIQGNERVLSARLADAEFFFNNDKKTKLEDRVEKLKAITYQQKLGSLYDKCQRISFVSTSIAKELIESYSFNINLKHLSRAAYLIKTDLVTEMVFEFTELQGVMGKYYALNDQENSLVADCIEQHYWPKQSGDPIAQSIEACILSLSDKIDSIVGIFAIGQKPTGDKDPFGLRRAALGLLRTLIEKELPLDLQFIISKAIDAYQEFSSLTANEINTLQELKQDCCEFCFERLKKYYLDKGININLFHSVSHTKTSSPHDFNQRIIAVSNFLNLPQAEQLIAANKRVKNILSKQEIFESSDILKGVKIAELSKINDSFLQEDAEKNLINILVAKNSELQQLFSSRKYDSILQSLATLQVPIDDFFDNVMVMSENDDLKNNRLLILKNIQNLFNEVADISELQQ